MKQILILLAALEMAVTVCLGQAQNRGREENSDNPSVPSASLVVAKITNQEVGVETRNNNLITALYVYGTFTNTNTLAINLHSFHVTGLDASGNQVANSDCAGSEGRFSGSLASGETTYFKAELLDEKREIRMLKVELN